jgi:hypothetical protein
MSDVSTTTAPCVINPFALAEAVCGRHIELHSTTDPRLEVARYLHISWHELLDPERSHLFLALHLSASELAETRVKKPESAEKPAPLPISLLDFVARLDPAARHRASAVLLPMLSESASDEWMEWGIAWEDLGDFFTDGAELGDPVQGAAGDCALIAALASIAWESRNR